MISNKNIFFIVLLLWCTVFLGLANISLCSNDPPPPCFSDIYCHGKLLHTIQMAKIYQDSKTFVDMKLRFSPNETLNKFDVFMKYHNDSPSRSDIKKFVADTFEPEGQEFETWDPKDWIPNPKFVDNIKDDEFRRWALKLNDIWKDLGRKIKDEVKASEELYSIIWVNNPVIVPGGRFREFYYWDSYWIVQGLLLSEMKDTVKGMLDNFMYIVDTYGHIPNGGRIYYLERSQPPLLIPMVKLYYDYTKDLDYINGRIETLEKEFDYWIVNHSKNIELDGKTYTLSVYGDKSQGPRPESYSEDYDGAAIFKENVKKEEFYSELKAAAESGWDFSSRWFILNATNKGNLTNIKTRSIVPVDLNAIMYWNAVLLSEFNELLGNKKKALHYRLISENWLEAVTKVLWHEETGAWLDYDLQNSIKRDYFYPTNIAPLWTGCYNKENKDQIIRLVMKYLQNKNILYPGGVPTTFEHTGEQWDYPNAWPPLQHIMIVGLNNTGDAAARRLAFEIAEKWVLSNFKTFEERDAMFEKYDAIVSGGKGGGGEYEVQLGFGWSNGVIMDLLYRYGDVLRREEEKIETNEKDNVYIVATSPSSTIGQISTVLVALLASLTAGYIGISLYKRHSKKSKIGKPKPHSSWQYTELKNMPQRAESRSSRQLS